MNKLILIFLVFVSLTAQAYEPLIREDRVWEYIEQEGVVNGFFDVRYLTGQLKPALSFTIILSA